MCSKFYIGDNTLNGRRLLIDYRDLLSHWMIVGGTGRGKSKLLELRMRFHIEHGHGGIVLDPHGFLYDDILAYATAAGYRNRLVLINLNDLDNTAGLNFLARNGLDSSAHAAQIMKASAKVFGEEGGDVKPRLERWQRDLIMALIEADLTLADMLDFLSLDSPQYRKAALSKVSNPYVRKEWEEFDAIKKHADKQNLIESPLNRACKLILSDPIRRILGQQDSTINIGEAVERGQIVLVNLAPLKVSRECCQILGILLVDQLINYAFTRTKQQARRRPFFLVADEADELCSDDLPYSLQALRKFGVFSCLCYQTLSQIKKIPGYYDNVMANCDIKVAFKSSRADSEELIGELFAGRIRGDEVKDEIDHTIWVPRETMREVIGTGFSESESHGQVDSFGDSLSEGSGSGSGSSIGSGLVEHFLPGDGLFVPDTLSSQSHSNFSSSSMSEFNMNSSGSFSGHSDIYNQAKTKSETRTIVPFYEYIREQELSSRQYYSIQEIKEKYIAWVMCQPQRHAQIKVGDRRAVPIMTAYVDEIRVRDKDKQKVIDRSNAKYTLPAAEVDRMIEERRERLLQSPDMHKQSEEEGDHWQ